jgi:hypothetical protein
VLLYPESLAEHSGNEDWRHIHQPCDYHKLTPQTYFDYLSTALCCVALISTVHNMSFYMHNG